MKNITNASILHGDCRQHLTQLPDNSIDAIVTDPPYGIDFDGNAWDSDVPPVDVWRECLRVLKPGAHLLAFASTRTQHRMASRIEEAGFRVRDMVAWIYGSGFPKSRDCSAEMAAWLAGERLVADDHVAIADPDVLKITAFLRAARDAAGWTNKQIDALFGTNGMAGHWTTQGTQPAVPSWEQWQTLQKYLGFTDELSELAHALAAREKNRRAEKVEKRRFLASLRDNNATTSGTKQTWGTALKPALEPITLAQKPPLKLSAALRRHGTGALNLAATAVVDADGVSRWPNNVMHDGDDQCLALFPDDSARFFYQAKANNADRHDVGHNDHPTVKPTDLMRRLCRLIAPPGGTVLDPFAGSGSTGKAAVLEGFSFIGIERNADFCDLARARIAAASGANASARTGN